MNENSEAAEAREKRVLRQLEGAARADEAIGRNLTERWRVIAFYHSINLALIVALIQFRDSAARVLGPHRTMIVAAALVGLLPSLAAIFHVFYLVKRYLDLYPRLDRLKARFSGAPEPVVEEATNRATFRELFRLPFTGLVLGLFLVEGILLVLLVADLRGTTVLKEPSVMVVTDWIVAVSTAVTAITVVVYTVFTRRLVVETRRGNEAFPGLTYEPSDRTLYLRNFGSGPAVNVRVSWRVLDPAIRADGAQDGDFRAVATLSPSPNGRTRLDVRERREIEGHEFLISFYNADGIRRDQRPLVAEVESDSGDIFFRWQI